MSVTVDQILKLRVDPLTLDGDGTVANPLTVIGGTGGGDIGRDLQTVLATASTPLDFNDEQIDYWQIDLSSVSATTLTASGPLASKVPILTLHFINLMQDTDVTFPASFRDASDTPLGTVTLSEAAVIPFYYANGIYYTSYLQLQNPIDTIGGLTVALNSPQDDDVLTISGGQIINAPAQGGGGGAGIFTLAQTNGVNIAYYQDRPLVIGTNTVPSGFSGAAYFLGTYIKGAPRMTFRDDAWTIGIGFGGFGDDGIASSSNSVFIGSDHSSWVDLDFSDTVILGASPLQNLPSGSIISYSMISGTAAANCRYPIKESVAYGYRASSNLAPQANHYLEASVSTGFLAGACHAPALAGSRDIFVGHGAGGSWGSTGGMTYSNTIIIANSSVALDTDPVGNGGVGIHATHHGQCVVGNPAFNYGMNLNIKGYLKVPVNATGEEPGSAGNPAIQSAMIWYDANSNTFKGIQNGAEVTFTTT